jgi:ubiquinone biosynthesis protein COQ4
MWRRTLEAARALVAVLKDPADTKQVFRLVEAMSRATGATTRARMERSRTGARLLAARPEILELLNDRRALEELPPGSLGAAYLGFVRQAGISADGLVQASEEGARSVPGPDGYVQRRLRDTHDLWHTVTGYGSDLIGEGAVLAFTYAQTFDRGIGLLVAAGLLRARDPDARRVLVAALARGLRASWLPGVRWEDLLPLPLDEVRAQLRLGPPPVYEPFHARDLPPGGLLADLKPDARAA